MRQAFFEKANGERVHLTSDMALNAKFNSDLQIVIHTTMMVVYRLRGSKPIAERAYRYGGRSNKKQHFDWS